MKKVGGHFIADGSAINVNCGFIPDKFQAYAKAEETNPLVYIWYKEQGNTGNANAQYGYLLTGSTGVITKCADANNGVIEYDAGSTNYVMLPAPNGNGEVKVALSADFVAGAAQPTARSTTATGTVVRPSTHNGYVYECTVSAGVYGTEPTWGTTVGGTTSDGTNTWICREEKTVGGGGEGVTVGATISTDSDEWTWEAELWDKVTPEVDAASVDPV